jgi:hypothetical protein
MSTAEGIRQSALARFFPRSINDPRAHLVEAEKRPPYYLGDDWTPKPEEVADARKRQQARRERAETRWRAASRGFEFDTARTAIACATDRDLRNDDDRQRYRTLRKLAFDDGAEIFIRNLRVSTDRFLIELRHPLLRIDCYPVGFHFVGLWPHAWLSKDMVGVYLDGSRRPVERVFASDFQSTAAEPDLAETYLRFALDHISFNDSQFYLIADLNDFIPSSPHGAAANCDGQLGSLLTSQFRVGMPFMATAPEPEADMLDRLATLGLSEETVIPPTTLKTVKKTPSHPAYAIVFATIISGGRLQYTCFSVSETGTIRWVSEERLVAPGDASLPLVPLRSIDEQRRTLERALYSVGDAEHDP